MLLPRRREVCVEHETLRFKTSKIVVFRVSKGKREKGGFWKEKKTSFTRPLCARARAREREREEERKREKKKEDEERNVAKTTKLEKGSHFLRRRRSFSKKKPFAFECAKGILSNLGVYNA
jgi:hypothetical protein